VNEAPAVASASHIPVLEGGSYPARDGNLLRLLIDGENAFRRIGEAVEAARHSVWLSVAFMMPDFRMPDGRGSLFDLLDRASARGLDVRILFWRDRPESPGREYAFAGTPADRAMLAARGSRFLIRWERVPGIYCQHQKFWLIDAGQAGETAFVGGINPGPKSVVAPGHSGDGHFHDLYVELSGPSATDVHHNFVQRWNEASERAEPNGVWGHKADTAMAFPERASPRCGASRVQIQRHIPAGIYGDGRASPGGRFYDIAKGERSILDQYLAAIDAARRTIYLENQAIAIEPVLARLEAALARGVDIAYLTPGRPDEHVRVARREPGRKPQFDRLAALARYPNFTLAGMAGLGAGGRHSEVYVHAKTMLVDDAFATIGSCNLHAFSLFGHTELNASFWDPDAVRSFRGMLLDESLGCDTRALDDRAALALYRRIARENRLSRDRGDAAWQGIVYALDPATYGE
jgi:phosphatidylserine/phosphatidylglycerophosphate/cardiolipin synthase-like enzyme